MKAVRLVLLCARTVGGFKKLLIQRHPMLRAGVFSTGLVLYPATQLRSGGLPVGPGEILLIFWVGLTLLTLLINPREIGRTFLRVAGFWVIFALTLALGMLVGLVVEPFHDLGSIAHDIMAYCLLLAVSLLLAIDLADPVRRFQTVWLVVAFGVVVLLAQLADGFGGLPLALTSPWYFDRFRGWSLDPNQLGLMAATLTLLAIYLIERSRRVGQKMVAGAAGLFAFFVGLLTKSDSYLVCVMFAAAALLATDGWRALSQPPATWRLHHAGIIVILLALPFVILMAAPFKRDIADFIVTQTSAVYEQDGQGDTRLALWTEAIEKGVEAKLLGFGPGAHLTSKSYKRPPPDKFEAHNTALDLFTQGGVVAVLLFAWLCLSAFTRCWHAGMPSLAALAVGFTAFSMFHFVIRHPIFWFGIVLCLGETARSARARCIVAGGLSDATV